MNPAVAMGIGGGAAVAAIVALIIALLFARDRSKRADTMTDKAMAATGELVPKERRIAELERNIGVHEDNAKKTTAALAQQRDQIARLTERAAGIQKELADVAEKLGDNAPAKVVIDLASAAADELRRELGLLQEAPAPEAVPGAAAGEGGGGGGDGVLPDGAGRVRDP